MVKVISHYELFIVLKPEALLRPEFEGRENTIDLELYCAPRVSDGMIHYEHTRNDVVGLLSVGISLSLIDTYSINVISKE